MPAIPQSMEKGGYCVPFADRTLKCADCGTSFVFSMSEQEFFASKGYQNEPKRCPSCRDTRRQTRGEAPARQMYDAVCAECGVQTKVPFRPSGTRPVYCSNCFSEQRAGALR